MKITGKSTDDRLNGTSGNDTLIGLAGNDTLTGGEGADIYIISKADGYDEIDNYHTDNSKDVVRFTDVLPADIAKTARDYATGNLTLSYGNSQLVIDNYFFDWQGASSRIDRFIFADGTAWSNTDAAIGAVMTAIQGSDKKDYMSGFSDWSETMNGLANDDYVVGAEGNDRLDGGTGADNVIGEAGNDTLVGGKNNDYLSGGEGGDTYSISKTDGKDEIYNYDTDGGVDVVAFIDVMPSDIKQISRDYSSGNLTLRYGNSSLVIDNYFFDLTEGNTRIDLFHFADGTSWSNSDTAIAAKLQAFVGTSASDYMTGFAEWSETLKGLAGDDYVVGNAGNDVLNGGEGADTLIGGSGKDTYILNEAVAATNVVRINVGDSSVNNFDTVAGFKLGNGSTTTGRDQLDLTSPHIATNVDTVNGVDVGTIRSHHIRNGLISFDDTNDYRSALNITANTLSNVTQYLQINMRSEGDTVAFNAAGNSYVFQNNDMVVQLSGVIADGLSGTGLLKQAIWLV